MGAIRGEEGSQTPYDSKCMGPLVLDKNCTFFRNGTFSDF